MKPTYTAERSAHEIIQQAISEFIQIHVTTHTGKLDGIPSINTSVLDNPICARRAQDPESVCAKCYAARLLAYRTTTDDALRRNSAALRARLLTDAEAQAVPVHAARFVRIESFGDVANVTQARNYLRIVRTHPAQHFGAWTKNPGIWWAAIQTEGKPENMTLIYSSPKLNTPAQLPARLDAIVDHIFTVYDRKTYDRRQATGELRGAHACAGIACIAECGCACYRKDTPRHIAERLRG